MNAVDPNIVFERLRAETCKLLGFNIDALDAWQTAKVDTLSLLRLEQDRQMSAAMRGGAVDPRQIAAIGEQLERALRPADTGPNGKFTGARAKLAGLFESITRERERKLAEACAAEELVMAAEAMGVVAQTAQTSLRNGVLPPPANVKHSYLNLGPISSSVEPALPAPAPPPQPASNGNWRDWVDEGGIRSTRRGSAPGGPPRNW